MRLLLLNQYGPPDSPPTARLLGELAEFFRNQGHEVEILAQRKIYADRPTSGKERLRRELAASWFILREGWRKRKPRPDVVLALSSPPGLPVVAALIAWRQRARLAHWAMDLYPELAVALGEVPPGVVSRLVQAAMRFAYRRAEFVVALDDDMRIHLQPSCRTQVQVLPPWPPHTTELQIAKGAISNLPSQDPAVPWVWLYSGNLGRAHEWHTLLDAQRLIEARGLPIHLVFQGDGAARKAARAYAEGHGLQRCEWLDYVAEDRLLASLLSAQALIVTQLLETQGLLWPSKLAVLERLPRPILFVGPPAGAIAKRLRARGNVGVIAPGQAKETADWIERQFHQPQQSAANLDLQPGGMEGCATLERWLIECADPRMASR